MLEELHVRDLALIEDVWLELGPGMTVLSGETGAGKTALVGALKLLVGERADASAVRAGADEAVVEGRFVHGDAEIVARRRVSADGRSRCTLDGDMASVSTLASVLGPLVDLHGQHDHQALLSASTHLGYLDRWAGPAVADPLAAYREARAAHAEAAARLAALESRIAEATRDADRLRFLAGEIAAVDPRPAEDAAIASRLPALEHAERLSQAADSATRALRTDGGATDRIAEAASALAKVAGIDPALDEIGARVAEVAALAEDAGMAARAYRDGVEHDPAALDAAHARLADLTGLMRKYGPRLDDVIAARDDALAALSEADDSSAARTAAARRAEAAEAALRAGGEALAAARRQATPGFVTALRDAVADLAMDGARFEVGFVDLPFEQWTAEGPHRAEFLYAAAPGQPTRPLAKIASGGEISRVMLALKGVLGHADEVSTLVFDEIDAGIGGQTAHAVGRRLAELSRSHQVLVITHLAQVAAFADAHLVVSKELRADDAATSVTTVAGDAREAEIARMLSGTPSGESLAHARRLLAEAAGSLSR